METIHPWCQRILTPFASEAALQTPVADNNPLWENVEMEMVRLGSLSHSQFNIDSVTEQCLQLLEKHSKDMRILTHLLHCLQWQNKPALVITALNLLETWIQAYWTLAWPHQPLHKQRLMLQILRRFEQTLTKVAPQLSVAELDQLLQQITAFHLNWQQQVPEQQELTAILVKILERQKRQYNRPVNAVKPASGSASQAAEQMQSGSDDLPLADTSDERGLRQLLLKIAQMLTENHSENCIGYRLRRHALWQGISSAPPAKNNKTELAAVSADRISEYQQSLQQGDLGVWSQIEFSLTMSPFWLDGHRLSAQAASQSGYPVVASAIHEELTLFLQRIPQLKTLCFSDGSPFCPAACTEWLQPKNVSGDGDLVSLTDAIIACYQQDGLRAALALLNQRVKLHHQQPREQFYAQLTLAQLLDQESMSALAKQYYVSLWQEAQHLTLAQWEPDLLARLKQLTGQSDSST